MITIDLAGIYLFLFKLSATICIISAVTFGFLMLAGVDPERDEGVWGFIVVFAYAAGAASFAMLIILLLALVIFYIWKI